MRFQGMLDIKFLNGFSDRAHGMLRALTYNIDVWIEHNTAAPTMITVDNEYYRILCEQVGYEVDVIKTIVGDLVVVVPPEPYYEVFGIE